MNRPTPPLRILVVEDEALLAMDMEAMIEDCGHEVVAEAASLHDVEDLPPDLSPDLAFVDVQLAQGTSGIDVSTLLQQRWPATFIVYVTANPAKLPHDYGGAHGVIPKPFSRNGLMAAMRYITEAVTEPPPISPMPASFVASPSFAASWESA